MFSKRRTDLAADPMRKRPTLDDLVGSMLTTTDRSGHYLLGSIKLTPVGLVVPDNPTDDELISVGSLLSRFKTSFIWWRGDFEIAAEKKWGDSYQDMMEKTGLAYKTLANGASVNRAIEFSRRRENLDFSHHAEVASLPPAEQDKWLKAASEGDELDDGTRKRWSVRRLREEIYRDQHDDQPPPKSYHPDKQTRIVARQIADFARKINRGEQIAPDELDALEAVIAALRGQ